MVGKSDGPIFSAQARPAKVGTSWQLDLTWPLGPFGHQGAQVYLQAQYFDGWAENLLDYRRHREILRFGVAFIR